PQVDAGTDLRDPASDVRRRIAADRPTDNADVATDFRGRADFEQPADDDDVFAHLAVDSRGAADDDDVVDDLVSFDDDPAANLDAILRLPSPSWSRWRRRRGRFGRWRRRCRF